jgi:hypothetical protein
MTARRQWRTRLRWLSLERSEWVLNEAHTALSEHGILYKREREREMLSVTLSTLVMQHELLAALERTRTPSRPRMVDVDMVNVLPAALAVSAPPRYFNFPAFNALVGAVKAPALWLRFVECIVGHLLFMLCW